MTELTFESIAFQTSRKLFDELSAALESIVGQDFGEKALQKKIDSAKIAEIIQRHTNLNVSIEVFNGEPGAFVAPMVAVRNNPLVYNYWKGAIQGKTIKELLSILKKADTNVGYVDLKNAKVHGMFKEIPVPIYFSTGEAKLDSAEELAAVLLHETGHGFTFMQMVSTLFLRNYALAAIADEIIRQEDPSHRVVILKDVNDSFKHAKLNSKELQELEVAKKAGEIHFAFLNADIAETKGETGCDFYDLISAEYLADQFAARMGASAALASALNKSYSDGTYPEKITSLRWITNIIEIIRWTFLTLISLGIIPMITALLIIIFGLNPETDIYDKPLDRIKRIRQQLIGEIKLTVDVEIKKKLLVEISTIDDIMKTLTPFVSIIDKLWITLVPSFKRDVRDKNIQKQIESIAYNDIFIHSATLDTLA